MTTIGTPCSDLMILSSNERESSGCLTRPRAISLISFVEKHLIKKEPMNFVITIIGSQNSTPNSGEKMKQGPSY